jgi:hypothetical protein
MDPVAVCGPYKKPVIMFLNNKALSSKAIVERLPVSRALLKVGTAEEEEEFIHNLNC